MIRIVFAVFVSVVLAGSAALAACGSSSSGSSNAESLLKQTFSGSHTVNSGVLTFSLSATPQGSSTIKGPITLSLDGPFQSRGHGKLPATARTQAGGAPHHCRLSRHGLPGSGQGGRSRDGRLIGRRLRRSPCPPAA